MKNEFYCKKKNVFCNIVQINMSLDKMCSVSDWSTRVPELVANFEVNISILTSQEFVLKVI